MAQSSTTPLQFDGTLGEKSVRCEISEFKGKKYLSLRYMYTDDNNKLCYGKNGINIPIEDAQDAIDMLTNMLAQGAPEHFDEPEN